MGWFSRKKPSTTVMPDRIVSGVLVVCCPAGEDPRDLLKKAKFNTKHLQEDGSSWCDCKARKNGNSTHNHWKFRIVIGD